MEQGFKVRHTPVDAVEGGVNAFTFRVLDKADAGAGTTSEAIFKGREAFVDVRDLLEDRT
jgi:hypothetical protein